MKLTRRSVAGALLAAAGLALAAPLRATPDADPLDEQTGGETTAFATGRNALSSALATLSDEEHARFEVGHSFFNRNWVEAPSSTTARDGLGPHFISRACGGCHLLDGRGAPPKPGEQPVALLMRLSVPGIGTHGGVVPDPVYGDQFDNAAVQGVKPEGRVTISQRALGGRFADGTRYTLMQPRYGFTDLAYGPMAADVMTSPRIAAQLAGAGLLEAIPDAEILKNAAEQARTAGPVRGQVNRVWDAFANDMRIGRFGWKANVASLAHQTAGAFLGDMGITSSTNPNEACTPTQADCLAAPRGGKDGAPEIDDRTFGDVVFYTAALAPAARRNPADARVRQGQRLFAQAQCDACHRPSYLTGASPFPQFGTDKLAGQRIWPYTDLLLHDMGAGLADGRPDFAASGSQWKTPPLWGLGLIPGVNGHNRLLHDGRARGALEAVLWHGGEAEASKQQVLRMSRAERDALVKFLESL